MSHYQSLSNTSRTKNQKTSLKSNELLDPNDTTDFFTG